jgi:hypothetical protein
MWQLNSFTGLTKWFSEISLGVPDSPCYGNTGAGKAQLHQP